MIQLLSIVRAESGCDDAIVYERLVVWMCLDITPIEFEFRTKELEEMLIGAFLVS